MTAARFSPRGRSEAEGKLSPGQSAVQTGAILALAGCLCLTSAALQAQNVEPCIARARELSGQSASARLRELTRAELHRDVIADAAGCSSDSTALVSRVVSAAIRGRNDTLRIQLDWPGLRVSTLGGIADPRGDGSMWSGRGTSVHLGAAVSLDAWRVHALIAPSFWWSENGRFSIFPSADTTLNRFASPWYDSLYSIDLPSRPGVSSLGQLDFGSSALWANLGPVDAGVAASSQSWGPGLRAHLLLGPDAPGIPRWFARTARPIGTKIGPVSASAFAGTLTESRFFDADTRNDNRSLWAWAVALNPGDSRIFTVGVAQGIMSGVAEQPPPSDTVETRRVRPRNRMVTMFARARSPDDAFRGWVELGRMGRLPTLRQFLTVPYAGLAYVMGFEYGRVVGPGTVLVSSEIVNLEQTRDIQEIEPRDFYTSADIPQGWTQRGRVLGVATGPGSQSQYISADWIDSRWSAGIFGERVRWNEDAFLRQQFPFPNRHDVTLRTGLRLGVVTGHYETSLQLSTGKRLNYLFQNGSYIPGFRTIDVAVPQLRLAITPTHRW